MNPPPATNGRPHLPRPICRAEVVAALVTPCRSTGEIDPPAMRRLTRNLVAHGCDGLFALGSTGEMILIDEDDRRRLVVATREGAPEDVSLLVGVGGVGPRQVVRYARFAGADGADVAIVMAPFFQRLSQAELTGYIEQIADESPIPVGVYHHLRMPTAFEIDTLAHLAGHPNIVLCKDTSTDLGRMRRLASATHGSGLRLLQGSERLILPSLQAGAQGCVSALAGIAPEWHRELIDAFGDGRPQQAEECQQRLERLLCLFELPQARESLAHFVHTLKYSAVRRGWLDSTAGLLPGFEPSAEFEKSILAILYDVGLLSPSPAPLTGN